MSVLDGNRHSMPNMNVRNGEAHTSCMYARPVTEAQQPTNQNCLLAGTTPMDMRSGQGLVIEDNQLLEQQLDCTWELPMSNN